ncbi:MAG: ribosome biogenesis GTPase Der [Anaerolineae bacterium]|nr:ribosome biogenesis GTPase Der [Anaerolineae bacterium]
MTAKPMVALVGRPNVGKSTLFNRLVGSRKAVVDSIPGTTRDRLQDEADWNGVTFTVVDTGGIEIYQPKGTRDESPLAEGSIDFVPQIRAQALIAMEEAEVIVMLVDAIEGVTAADQEVAEILRRTNKPVLIAANKADNQIRRDNAVEFYGLGLGEVFPVSALHGTGSGDLLDAIVKELKNAPAPDYDIDPDDDTLKIAIVGRPNVGKSSLINALLGEERAIVSPVAGTTRDAIDTRLTWEGVPVLLIDTAGIRRRGKVAPGVEKYSVLRANKAIQRADVVLLVLDAVDGITVQDTHIAGMVLEEFKSVVVVVNKWDAVDKDTFTINEYTEKIQQELNFLPYVPILFISAKTGRRVHQVIPTASRIQEERLVRIPTSELNRIVREAVDRHAPPSKAGKRLKIYLAQQVRTDPPTLLFHVNDTRLVHFTYERYLENRIRKHYPFTGTPLRLTFRPREGMLKR